MNHPTTRNTDDPNVRRLLALHDITRFAGLLRGHDWQYLLGMSLAGGPGSDLFADAALMAAAMQFVTEVHRIQTDRLAQAVDLVHVIDRDRAHLAAWRSTETGEADYQATVARLTETADRMRGDDDD